MRTRENQAQRARPTRSFSNSRASYTREYGYSFRAVFSRAVLAGGAYVFFPFSTREATKLIIADLPVDIYFYLFSCSPHDPARPTLQQRKVEEAAKRREAMRAARGDAVDSPSQVSRAHVKPQLHLSPSAFLPPRPESESRGFVLSDVSVPFPPVLEPREKNMQVIKRTILANPSPS